MRRVYTKPFCQSYDNYSRRMSRHLGKRARRIWHFWQVPQQGQLRPPRLKKTIPALYLRSQPRNHAAGELKTGVPKVPIWKLKSSVWKSEKNHLNFQIYDLQACRGLTTFREFSFCEIFTSTMLVRLVLHWWKSGWDEKPARRNWTRVISRLTSHCSVYTSSSLSILEPDDQGHTWTSRE